MLEQIWQRIYDYSYLIDRPELKQFHDRLIQEFGSELVESIPVRQQTVGSTRIWVFDGRNSKSLLHNTQEPAVVYDTGGVKYYLYNLGVSQEEWFDILGWDEQQRLMHCLKWGRKSSF